MLSPGTGDENLIGRPTPEHRSTTGDRRALGVSAKRPSVPPPALTPFDRDLALGRRENQPVVTIPPLRGHPGRQSTVTSLPTLMPQRIGTILPKHGRFGTLDIPTSSWNELRDVISGLGARMYLNEPLPGERGTFLGSLFEAPCYLVGVEFADGVDPDEVIAAVDPVLAAIVERHHTHQAELA